MNIPKSKDIFPKIKNTYDIENKFRNGFYSSIKERKRKNKNS